MALSIVLYVWSVTAFDDYFDSVEAGRPDWRLGLLQGLIFESAFILVLAAGGVWGYYVSHYERRVRVYNAELFARSRDGERIGEPIDLVCVAKAADAGQGAGSSVSVGRLTRGIAIVAMLVAALAVVVTAIAAYLWVAEFAAATAGRAWQGPGQQGAWQFYLPAGAVFALLAAALWTWNGHRQFAYAVHRST